MSPNRNGMVEWSRGALAAFAVAFTVIGGVGGYGFAVQRADGRAAEANQRAAIEAERADVAQALADSALEAHAFAVRELRTLEAKRTAPATRLATVRSRPIPAPCDTIVQTILAAADTVIAVDSARIAVLEADNARLTTALSASRSALASAEAELRQQAKRTETAPRKLLGLVPMPDVVAGYGMTYAGNRTTHGPVLAVAWKVAL